MDGKERCFLWSRRYLVRRFACVRCPVPGPPRPESVVWLVPLPADPCGWPLYWFCGGHGPGETPGPFPNPEAKAWHGDGTALERVWESSTPPHSTVWTFWSSPLGDSRKVFFLFPLGVPAGRNAPETPIFLFRRPAGRSTLPGVPEGLSCFRSARSVSGFPREFLLFHKDFW